MKLPPVLAFFLVMDISLFIFTPVDSCSQHRVTIREMEEAIKRELPLGSSKAQVIAFLDAKRIHHGEIILSKYESEYPDNGVEKRLIFASIPKVRKVLFMEWGIHMSFRFDENDRLIDYRVRLVGSGL